MGEVNPAVPGWREILIRPRPLSLPAASGQVVTPVGAVRVEWTNGPDGFRIRASVPANVPVKVVLPDGSERVYPDGGEIEAGA